MGLSKKPQKAKKQIKTYDHVHRRRSRNTHDTNQALTRWTQWVQQHFSKTEQENKNIQIEHIKEQTWNEMKNAIKSSTTTMTQSIHPNLSIILEQTQLIKAQQKYPQITNMLLKDYTRKDIQQAIKRPKTTKRMEQMEYQQNHLKQSITG